MGPNTPNPHLTNKTVPLHCTWFTLQPQPQKIVRCGPCVEKKRRFRCRGGTGREISACPHYTAPEEAQSDGQHAARARTNARARRAGARARSADSKEAQFRSTTNGPAATQQTAAECRTANGTGPGHRNRTRWHMPCPTHAYARRLCERHGLSSEH